MLYLTHKYNPPPIIGRGFFLCFLTAGQLVTGTSKAWLGNIGELAKASHNHAAGDITSGILPVTRGGTGKSEWAANRLVMYGTSSLDQVTLPANDNAILCQNITGAPYWSTVDEMKDILGINDLAGIVTPLLPSEYFEPTLIETTGSFTPMVTGIYRVVVVGGGVSGTGNGYDTTSNPGGCGGAAYADIKLEAGQVYTVTLDTKANFADMLIANSGSVGAQGTVSGTIPYTLIEAVTTSTSVAADNTLSSKSYTFYNTTSGTIKYGANYAIPWGFDSSLITTLGFDTLTGTRKTAYYTITYKVSGATWTSGQSVLSRNCGYGLIGEHGAGIPGPAYIYSSPTSVTTATDETSRLQTSLPATINASSTGNSGKGACAIKLLKV